MEIEKCNNFKPKNKIFKSETLQEYEIVSIYNFEKINSLFKNFNTMSFLNLVTNYDHLLNTGYNKKLLNENLHSMISMPFFLFLMTALASIFTMYNLKNLRISN